MTEDLSQNTKAILLLTAPLTVGRSRGVSDLLAPGEYKRFAHHLRQLGAQPADLLTSDVEKLLSDSDRILERTRAQRLLGRGFLLGQAVERWRARSIWVLSRADAEYPQRLKARLKEDSPPVLYGCGRRESLGEGGLAVVGSRNVTDELLSYTKEIGHLAARAKRPLVSGGARGVDQAAMHGALEAGGRAIGVLADSLDRAVVNREHRAMLLDERLLLISPYDPCAAFNVGHAMQRNKLIYALADAALVVNAEVNKGGTWTGATEQLDKLRLVPIYVRSSGPRSPGIEALASKGALPWPNPDEPSGLDAILDGARTALSPSQPQLSFGPQPPRGSVFATDSPPEAATVTAEAEPCPAPHTATASPAAELLGKVRDLVCQLLAQPKKADEVASDLGVTKTQAERWMKTLADEGIVRRLTKRSSSYVLTEDGLFRPMAPTTPSPPPAKRATRGGN